MSKSIIVTYVSVSLLLAFVFWLKTQDNLASYNADSYENASELTNANIEGINSQYKVETISREQFQPNTNWPDKTMTVNGTELTYKFGEGNPSEVALLPEEYLPKKGKDGIPYVTPKVEYQLQEFISDKNLPELLNKCVNYLDDKMMAQNLNISANQIVSVLDNNDVDIKSYLIIDEKTGRKMIDLETDYRMNEFLNTLNNPLDRSPLILECFGLNKMQDFKIIQKKFHALGKAYNHTNKGIL